MQPKNLAERQEARMKAAETETQLENQFFDLCGIAPSIISPENKPFAVFRPDTIEDYLKIISSIEPAQTLAEVTFADKESIKTFSQYLITYGGESESKNYFEVTVKFETSICKVWVIMPKEIMAKKFSISEFQGKSLGFGRYKYKYTITVNKSPATVQSYYGRNKTIYAASQEEAFKLKTFIFNQ